MAKRCGEYDSYIELCTELLKCSCNGYEVVTAYTKTPLRLTKRAACLCGARRAICDGMGPWNYEHDPAVETAPVKTTG